VVNVACPLAFSGTVPIDVAPSEKVTVPVGVPVPGASGLIVVVPGVIGVTVAVNVTESPDVDGFRLEARVVVVGTSTT
jgi:hypothetical protein